MTSHAKSEQLFAEALKYIPGGVNSPVRAFRAVGGQPFFVNKAKGARVWDVDGNEYLDYVGTWGPAILGHAHPRIIEAVRAAAQDGTSFGIPNPFEVTLAKMICAWVPSVQKVRMCNSGTEACMSAIRLARGFTRRDKIIKFDGCYHGHADSLLVKAGSGALTFGNPDSAGVPAAFTQHTIVLPYNDRGSGEGGLRGEPRADRRHHRGAGAGQRRPVFAEARAIWNSCARSPRPTARCCIFDEVMTGFRLAKGGAQERFGITPDLSCFGKVIGGGLPVGAFGGRAEIMDCLAPVGPVYQAGTLSGNPVAMAAGIAALEELAASDAYAKLEELGAALEAGMKDAAKSAGVPVQFNRCGSMFCAYFTSEPVHNVAEAMKSDRERFKRYFHGMLAEGIYLAPSQFEAGFLSTGAHRGGYRVDGEGGGQSDEDLVAARKHQ